MDWGMLFTIETILTCFILLLQVVLGRIAASEGQQQELMMVIQDTHATTFKEITLATILASRTMPLVIK